MTKPHAPTPTTDRLTRVQMWEWSESFRTPYEAVLALLGKLTQSELHHLKAMDIHAEQKRRQGGVAPAAAVGANAVNGRL